MTYHLTNWAMGTYWFSEDKNWYSFHRVYFTLIFLMNGYLWWKIVYILMVFWVLNQNVSLFLKSAPTWWRPKMGPKKGCKIQNVWFEQFIHHFLYFSKCRIQICHYFWSPSHRGAEIEPKKGVKYKMCDLNNLYIIFYAFQSAEFKFAIIFEVHHIRGLK